MFVLFSVPAIIMATDYCADSEDRHGNPYPCDNVAQMVLSMRSLATALIYFRDRDRRAELFDFRVLCRKLWRRLKADARLCAATATGGRGVARGTGDGYRLQFKKDLESVQEFITESPAASVVTPPGDHNEDGDAGIAYQLMEDDDDATRMA